MDKTQYLIFEIGRECNLGHVHVKCPNKHPDRYKHVDTSQAMSDDTIVDTAVAMIQQHGFRGLIGWHYYNEPTLHAARMCCVMERIRKREPSAEFVLWTNGVRRPMEVRRLDLFSQIHVTDYGLLHHPCWFLQLEDTPGVSIHRWPLDDRLTATGDEPGRPESDAPCCRMFTEMIFDYYGNVHLCCYDWRGLGSIGNIHTATHDRHNTGETTVLRKARTRHAVGNLVIAWQCARQSLIGRKLNDSIRVPTALYNGTFSNYDVPHQVCRTCTAPGRNVGITDFVKAPAEAVRAYRQEVLNGES